MCVYIYIYISSPSFGDLSKPPASLIRWMLAWTANNNVFVSISLSIHINKCFYVCICYIYIYIYIYI